MAIATANIYRATVYLSAGNAAGVQPVGAPGPAGQVEAVIIAQTPAAAISILQQYFTSPAMVGFSGPVLVATGALTTGTGTLLAEDTVGLPAAHSDEAPEPRRHARLR